MTDVPLKEHIETQLKALHDAVEKAERQLDTRMLVTKAEYNVAHEYLMQQMRRLELYHAEQIGQAKNSAIIAAVISAIVVGVISTVIAHWITK